MTMLPLYRAGVSSSSPKFDVFGSHNWGNDEEGRDNHRRVKNLFVELKRAGFSVWVDEGTLEHAGNAQGIHAQICSGVDQSCLFVACITRLYMRKIRDGNPNGGLDNCQAEFNYAVNRKQSGCMVALVMEPFCLSVQNWSGPVGMALGTKLYIDFSDDTKLSSACQSLAETVWGQVPKGTRRVDGSVVPHQLIVSPLSHQHLNATHQRPNIPHPQGAFVVGSPILITLGDGMTKKYMITMPTPEGPQLLKLSSRIGTQASSVIPASIEHFRIGELCAIKRSDGRMTIGVVSSLNHQGMEVVVDAGNGPNGLCTSKKLLPEHVPSTCFKVGQ
eukprot:2897033-Rhodomonas_salina.5